MVTGLRLERATECDNKPYRELIGGLMYLATTTRPDIAHAVSVLSQFNDYHNEEHWLAAKRVLRYLKGTKDVGLVFGASEDLLTGYADADYANDVTDRKSYTGYVFSLGGTAISWESRKQRSVATSSAEAEYIAISEAAKESIYLNDFLLELGFNNLSSKLIYNDNQSAKLIADGGGRYSRTKHIDVKYHFLRSLVQEGSIIIQYLPTNNMIADILTKGLPRIKHEEFTANMGLSTLRGSVKDSNVSPPDPYSYGTACRYTTSEWGPNRRVV